MLTCTHTTHIWLLDVDPQWNLHKHTSPWTPVNPRDFSWCCESCCLESLTFQIPRTPTIGKSSRVTSMSILSDLRGISPTLSNIPIYIMPVSRSPIERVGKRERETGAALLIQALCRNLSEWSSSVIHDRQPWPRNLSSPAPRSSPLLSLSLEREKQPEQPYLWQALYVFFLRYKMLLPINLVLVSPDRHLCS